MGETDVAQVSGSIKPGESVTVTSTGERMSTEDRKQVYWDAEKRMFYWIEWVYTGNSDIPVKHYIQIK